MNPGVSVERIEFNVWDAAGLRTAVAGGTAPFHYPIGVLGNWNVPGIQASYAEGLFADITNAFEKNKVLDLLDPKVAANSSRWKTQDGTIFGIPYEVVSSEGFFFNREHLAEIGMDDLPFNWKWTDMREIALKLTKAIAKAWQWLLMPWIGSCQPTGSISMACSAIILCQEKALIGAGTSPHLWMISSRESTYGVP
jgi:hypothetical protein